MKNFPVLALLFLLTVSSTIAQVPNRCSYVPPRQADNWLFFQNAGIKFSDASAGVNNPAVNNMPAGKGSASISDGDGNLILYTDGMKVWNSSDNIINFGPNLSGDLGSTQSSLIVPMPGSPQISYIFTTDIIYPASFGQTKGLNYSRVDMSINNNYGAVTDHNINLLAGATEMLTGVKHGNGNDFWVLAHGLGNNNFYAYLVTSTGVNESPEQSSGGSSLSDDYNLRENLGAMKISPKGDKVAFASFGKGTLELFSFDNQTGRVSNPLILNPPKNANQGPYYVEFSPDGTKLYVTVANLTTGRDNHLYQYDISTGGALVEINLAPDEADVSALQLGRDGKIYVSRYQRGMLGIIENPNRPGTACNYSQDGMDLTPKKALNGLPNFIQSFFDIPPVDYDTKCLGDGTVFNILNKSNNGVVTWDFGDDGNTAPGSGLNPVHVFSAPGEYTVTMTETFGGQPFNTIFPVFIDSLPMKDYQSFRNDSLYIFPGSSIDLSGPPDMYSYLWQDSSEGQFFKVTDPGLYSVEYIDINCCRNADSLNVISLDIVLPNAFSPDNNNLNDVFRPLGPTDGIQDFTLTVHDRWGQVVWEAANFEDAWDGTLNGQPLPTGVYAWNMTFNVIGNIMEIGKIKNRGTVTLLR